MRLGLSNSEQLIAAYGELSAIAGPWMHVEAMAPADRADLSTAFTISTDPSFGALVSFGIGGAATELFDDRAYRAVPLADVDSADLISAPRASPLLDGHWGARMVAREPLIDLDPVRPTFGAVRMRCPTWSCVRCSPGRPPAVLDHPHPQRRTPTPTSALSVTADTPPWRSRTSSVGCTERREGQAR